MTLTIKYVLILNIIDGLIQEVYKKEIGCQSVVGTLEWSPYARD